MIIHFAPTKEKKEVKISKSEYNLLKEAYNQFRRQFLLLRIIEAEESLKKRKVKRINIDEFIKSI